MSASSNGYCLCGCGERTEMWVTGNVGGYKPFVRGHARPLAPDGLAVRYQETKWCRYCSRRLPLEEFRGATHFSSYCRRCVADYQRERYRSSPEVRLRRIEADRLCKQRRKMREQREEWREDLQVDQERRAAELAERAAEVRAKEEEDALEKRDPLCLRRGDEQGLALMERAIRIIGTTVDLEERLGLSRDSLNKYRAERFLTFDLVDKILVLIGESDQLESFAFERRSVWIAADGPSESTKRRTAKRRANRQGQGT